MQQMHFLAAKLSNTSKSNMLRDIVVAPPLAALALSVFGEFEDDDEEEEGDGDGDDEDEVRSPMNTTGFVYAA